MDVNVALAQWSNLLIYSAMAVYAIAFIIYAFDLFGPAFAGDTQKVEEKAGRRSGRSTRPETGKAASTAAQRGGAAGSGTTAVLDDAEATGTSGAGDSADGGDAGKTLDVRRWARAGTALTVLAAAFHVGAIVTRTLAVMRVPWSNMMEYALIASAVVSVAYLVLLRFRDFRYLGTFVTFSVLLVLGLCITVFHTPAAQIIPALDNYWIWIHVPIAILSTVLLFLSAIFALVQIVRSRSESKPWRGPLRFINALPGSKDLEKTSYRFAAVGFVTWTFTLVAGAFWAEIAWGRYWGWDSKEIWTFVVWVVYAAYLHARATRGWTPTRVAVLNLVGIATVIFNFSIVNLYFNGLHAYSGV
ncbi:MAG: c-type cytochrome biogenesis protein CcsB [Brevibacterium yomogidense]|uniref:Cytochrome c-type biogenesis protein CcsA/ResC n=1 Tax=Brevibacterium yomogidense TaxID=946573 RepID=A0A1X6XHS2_9MICO|nr:MULTISPECIES: c-type cytochrome biogenesis protein CcsB [Brevibacterium]SLM98673.1 Cytochrome c-type biogenesis protein CcsA/ResC [Brevibacterium yomogidense]SMX64006.1 cytochrome c-type biogenesis protein CcsB [Brevibacterium sp. Mu109]